MSRAIVKLPRARWSAATEVWIDSVTGSLGPRTSRARSRLCSLSVNASAFLPSYGLAEATLAVSIMPPGEGPELGPPPL